MSAFPAGWALQKPQQTIEPELFERKWRAKELIATLKRDGNRAHVITAGENTRIYSRNGTLDWTDKLSHLVHAYSDAKPGWMIDVELHTLEEGTHSFQKAMNEDPTDIFSSPFDMIRVTGQDAVLGYEQRKANVDQFMEAHNSYPITTNGVNIELDPYATYDDVLKVIEARGIEGMVMWDRKAPHLLNLKGNTKRGQSWKIKIRQTEDLYVAGWNANKGDPALGAGSLNLMRVNEAGRRVKAGKVGSFDKSFDRHEAITREKDYIVEVSHYGIDENGNMTFPKVERYRDDLSADYGLIAA